MGDKHYLTGLAQLACDLFSSAQKFPHLSNSQGGGNKQGGDAKVPVLINEEEGRTVGFISKFTTQNE